MKKRIHINKHVIRSNKKNGENKPVLTVKTYNSNTYGHQVSINGPSRLVYRPEKPLSCGATVWIETNAPVDVYREARRINAPVDFYEETVE